MVVLILLPSIAYYTNFYNILFKLNDDNILWKFYDVILRFVFFSGFEEFEILGLEFFGER